MTIRTPILDDRTFAQLRDELIARIPVYTPEWTDHHPSDPGVTLLELFAFLGENLLWRFNQIPDATRLAFLDLLRIPMEPAVPATGMVRFDTGEPAARLVPASTRLEAGEVPFETLDEVHVLPLEARAAIRAVADPPADEEGAEYLARTRDALGLAADEGTTYRTELAPEDPNTPGGAALDPRRSVDGRLWVAVLGTDATDLSELGGSLLSIGVAPSEEVVSMTDLPACPGADAAGGGGAEVRWEISTVLPTGGGDPALTDPVWWGLTAEADTSGGLLRPGVVRLRLPTDLSDVGVYDPGDPDTIGAGDQPPLVEDEETDQRILFWLRAFRTDAGEIGALQWAGANASRVEQVTTATAEYLGTGTGEPDQRYRLVHAGVLGDPVVEVEEHGARPVWRAYRAVDDLRGAGPSDRLLVVDRHEGTVRFGPPGRIPQIGERIRAASYRYGGGLAGNVAPDAISRVRDVVGVEVGNPLATTGGADAETLEEAVERIPGEVRRRERAVTRDDFAELARRVPGVARAETLPRFHPATPQVDPAAGVVSVVVWPERDPRRPAAPCPARSLARRVCTELNRRRLVTTELHVIPPTYRRIAVAVGVRVREGYGIEAVRRWAELVLRQYLAPVPPYGPDGGGWPLGRRVHAPELEAAVLQVEGIEYLEGLRLAEEVDGGWQERAQPPTVELAKWEVPELVEITVVTGSPLEPGAAPLAPPPATGPAVPVRAPLEICG